MCVFARVCGEDQYSQRLRGEGVVFTEQLIRASSESLFHLVCGLHSVQML